MQRTLSNMQAINSIMLLVFFACPIHRSESSTPSNPTKQFFDDIQTRPVLTYQCYQSGNSIDAPGSVNYTILWYGIDKNADAFFGQTWSAINGTPDSYTRTSQRQNRYVWLRRHLRDDRKRGTGREVRKGAAAEATGRKLYVSVSLFSDIGHAGWYVCGWLRRREGPRKDAELAEYESRPTIRATGHLPLSTGDAVSAA
ncbi:uncharacterized protein ISCGN_005263 [Ixodes scapularis]